MGPRALYKIGRKGGCSGPALLEATLPCASQGKAPEVYLLALLVPLQLHPRAQGTCWLQRS